MRMEHSNVRADRCGGDVQLLTLLSLTADDADASWQRRVAGTILNGDRCKYTFARRFAFFQHLT